MSWDTTDWPDGCEFHHEVSSEADAVTILNAVRDGAPVGAEYVITSFNDGRHIIGYNAVGIPRGLAKAKIISSLHRLDEGGKRYRASRGLDNYVGTGTWHGPDIPRMEDGKFEDE